MLNVTPDIESLFQRAMQHHQSGQWLQAEALYRQILQCAPRHPLALHMLGVLAAQSGHGAAAVELIQQALAIKPVFPEAWANLGHAWRQLGHVDRAVASYRQALTQNPEWVELYGALGQALLESGLAQDAVDVYRQALARTPGDSETLCGLGAALRSAGRTSEAIAAFRQALALRPDFAPAYYNLGNALVPQGLLDEAAAAYRQALALSPGFVDAHSNLFCTLHYGPDQNPQAVFEEHRAWARQHAQALKRLVRPHAHDRDPRRRLRIGYASPDFREHSVAPMVLPLIAHHAHAQFEVFCYAQVVKPDAMTKQFREHADQWRQTVGLTDQQMADLVRQDQIDILIDLAGHTAGNRLLVFAQKPAPVQVARQGYPDTTGLDTIDYRMTDAWADPPGLADTLHTEKLVRLPETNWIYQPPAEARELPVPPFDSSAPLAFGCFNNFSKVSEPTLQLWAKLLAAVPGSRLLLKAKALVVASVRSRLIQLFAAQGVAPDRLELVPWTATTAEHLRLHNRVAIALDPFPYHGTTTTCDALWMGVPVITLAGQTHVSRVGVSLLTNVGTPELIAQTPEEYVRLAVELANDRPRLAHLHAELRHMLQASAIMNYERFARNIENAYRAMWRQWCTTPSPECPERCR